LLRELALRGVQATAQASLAVTYKGYAGFHWAGDGGQPATLRQAGLSAGMPHALNFRMADYPARHGGAARKEKFTMYVSAP